MNTKEASKLFSLSADVIRKLCKESNQEGVAYIKASKIKGKWEIDDSTKIILSKTQIRTVLYQILKYKNNKNQAISRRWFQNKDMERTIIQHLYQLGFITYQHNSANKLNNFSLDSATINDEGFTLLLNKEQKKVLKNTPTIKIINIENKIGGIVA